MFAAAPLLRAMSFSSLAVFASPLKPFIEVVRGQDAVLSCETFESTYFQWLKDGTTLMATSNKFRTGGDDKHTTLVVKQFNENDEGNRQRTFFPAG